MRKENQKCHDLTPKKKKRKKIQGKKKNTYTESEACAT